MELAGERERKLVRLSPISILSLTFIPFRDWLSNRRIVNKTHHSFLLTLLSLHKFLALLLSSSSQMPSMASRTTEFWIFFSIFLSTFGKMDAKLLLLLLLLLFLLDVSFSQMPGIYSYYVIPVSTMIIHMLFCSLYSFSSVAFMSRGLSSYAVVGFSVFCQVLYGVYLRFFSFHSFRSAQWLLLRLLDSGSLSSEEWILDVLDSIAIVTIT